jgi:large subunit ribosomal protein L21
MFAIVEISGEQFKVDESTKTLRVPYISGAQAGDAVTIDRVLMSGEGAKVSLGGTAPKATVQGHVRGEKVIVFHKKRRKGYRKTNGHTQPFTEVAINW